MVMVCGCLVIGPPNRQMVEQIEKDPSMEANGSFLLAVNSNA